MIKIFPIDVYTAVTSAESVKCHKEWKMFKFKQNLCWILAFVDSGCAEEIMKTINTIDSKVQIEVHNAIFWLKLAHMIM